MVGPVLTTFRAAAFLAVLAVPWSAPSAQPYERPPAFAADRIPGIKPNGENYTIPSPVRSDGLLRLYALTTPYGEFSAHGDQMARMRLNELAALAEIDKISGSETFSKALVDAGLSPLKYTGKLVTDPLRTVGDTLDGVKALFGSIGSGMANAGKTTGDDPVQGLLGVTTQKRQLAVKFGVDPYTDFEPLNVKLTRLSEAAAMGGLTVSGALFFVPGAAGIVVSNLSTANRLGDTKIDVLARDYTVSQIMDLNRQRLAAMGVDKGTSDALLANRTYTPVDMAAMVGALDGMNDVADRDVFFAVAAGMQTRATAYFMRRHAELLAGAQARTGAFTRFVLLGGYPFNVDAGGAPHRPDADRCAVLDPGDRIGDRPGRSRRQAPRARRPHRIADHGDGHGARPAAAQGAGLDGDGKRPVSVMKCREFRGGCRANRPSAIRR